MQQQRRQYQQESSGWKFIPFESLFILALIGLIAWLVSNSSPATTVAASDDGIMTDVINTVNGGKVKRGWVMYVVYAALGVLALGLFYALVRFALPHLFQKPYDRVGVDDIDKWLRNEAEDLGRHVQIEVIEVLKGVKQKPFILEENEESKDTTGTVKYRAIDNNKGGYDIYKLR